MKATKKNRITVFLNDDVYTLLKDEAKNVERSVPNLVGIIIKEHYNRAK